MGTKNVIITGGAEGTGLAITRKFASEGWSVFVTSRSLPHAVAVAGDIAAEYNVEAGGLYMDLQSERSIADMYRTLSDQHTVIDAIVLNAVNMGKEKIVDPLTCSIADWHDVIQSNITGNFMLAREAAKIMCENGGGSIVFISSNTAKGAIYNRSNYIASKGGINSLMRAMAVDLGKYSIRVNCLLPGVIFNDRIAAFPKERLDLIRRRSPLKGGEWSSVEDVANGTYFLASSMSGNMTGSEVLMDGGVCSLLGADSTKYAKNDGQ